MANDLHQSAKKGQQHCLKQLGQITNQFNKFVWELEKTVNDIEQEIWEDLHFELKELTS